MFLSGPAEGRSRESPCIVAGCLADSGPEGKKSFQVFLKILTPVI